MKFFFSIIAFLLASPASLFASPEEVGHIIEPNPWMIIPFVVLLLAIALMPFINQKWWHHYFPHVSIGLGLITIFYYVFGLDNAIRMLHSGIEYFSFICLIGSLFVVSGGIHFNLRGYSTPTRNILLLSFGAVIANIVGTTGASMILIRPFIRNNKYRLHPYHVVFFIFIVSNIGGALTPIGDPPLFLGYLKGIPFFWVMENVWYIWLFTLAIILSVFYVIDLRYYRKVPKDVREELTDQGEETKFRGMHNLGYLGLILIAVFIQDPPFVREAIMIAVSVASYLTTKKEIHEANEFTFFPIKEVGFLFLGLFATMVPALDWLELNASQIGIDNAGQFFWGTGILSSVLDNAPTYLNYLSAAIGLFVDQTVIAQVQQLLATHGAGAQTAAMSPEIIATYEGLLRYHGNLVAQGHVPISDINVIYLIMNHPIYVVAISLGAVFFGACTYIGNAPNFMVKSIAEHMGAKVPSFLEYIYRYSIPILIPIFIILWLMFFNQGG